ncbi:UDP-2,3-diacylglucosamine diphosphatase [Vibrio tapetis]|uniref:UDP-2,3-diacylglucosamine hydrolase n=1 Tax=Vibrio tapetis subsp. tapetis TaxID=1671868 RepID=A0A2N8ZAT4_9VIBR|nr:UDP-2,3-diacylglucosamine diphosphatase [Vibrio tapetis]SON49009.1 UDP-2,3-diacylglucosamine pyrophosphatase [Vibrio tapetis subsp. tapetis]
MTTLFISDLHLSPTRPDITQSFFQFLDQKARFANKLYVLGDLFDFWLGDDDNSDFASSIRQAFKQLTDSGVQCYFQHGNRDFLVGKRFARETGVQLLPEECKIDLYGSSAILLHGDTLCTDDIKYQEFRTKVHQPWLQRTFKCIPLFFRKKIVSNIQGQTRTDKNTKSLDIMDVNKTEVVRVMEKHDTNLMIHGHTHREATHQVLLTDNTQGTRIVLGDWDNCAFVLIVDQSGFKIEKLPFKQ